MTPLRAGLAALVAALSVSAGEYRAFWVNVQTPALKTPQAIDRLVQNLTVARANAVFAQMRSRGASYYRNSLETFTEDPDVPSGFDPLAYLIERAHKKRIEVHAWFPVTAFWNRERPPLDPRHAWHSHGPHAPGAEMWLTVSNLGQVATYVDPGHPAVMRHLADVIVDVSRRYAVDGIHLDYIRYPAGARAASDFGWNPTAVRRFNRLYRVEGVPARDNRQFADFRRKHVTDLVRHIYLRILAVNPKIRVSAALITWDRGPATAADFQRTDAYRYVFQDWQSWLKEGILDLGIGMNYFDETKQSATLDRWMEFEKNHQYRRAAMPGLGIYMNPIAASLEQMRRALRPSAAGNRGVGVALFSYGATNTLDASGQPSAPDAGFFEAAGRFFAHNSRPPGMRWKTSPQTGGVAGWLTVKSGPEWLNDNAAVYLQRKSDGETIALTSDATGFFGALNLAPDSYRIGLAPGQWISGFKKLKSGAVLQFTAAVSETRRLAAGPAPGQCISGFKKPKADAVLPFTASVKVKPGGSPPPQL